MSSLPEPMEVDSTNHKPVRNVEKQEVDGEEEGSTVEMEEVQEKEESPDCLPSFNNLPENPPPEIVSFLNRVSHAFRKRFPQKYSKKEHVRKDFQQRWEKLMAAIALFDMDEVSELKPIQALKLDFDVERVADENLQVVPLLASKAVNSGICLICHCPLVEPVTLGDQCSFCWVCLVDKIEDTMAFGPLAGFHFWFCVGCGTHQEIDDLSPLWNCRVNVMLRRVMNRLIPQWENDLIVFHEELDIDEKLKKMTQEDIENRLRTRSILAKFEARQKRAAEMLAIGHNHAMTFLYMFIFLFFFWSFQKKKVICGNGINNIYTIVQH